MRDRVPGPGKANRIRLTQDDGQTIEGVLSYADDATQEGSAYTKGNVLPDEVCDILGLDRESSEPRDAWLGVIAALGHSILTIRVLEVDGSPLEGFKVEGLTGVLEGKTYTDANGSVFVIVPEGEYTLSVPAADCIDAAMAEQTITVAAGEQRTIILQQTKTETTDKVITTAQNVRFSRNVQTVDVFCCGGGGGGGGGSGGSSVYGGAGGGGGGGYTTTRLKLVPTPYTDYPAVIGGYGSAGAETTSGGKGGTTSFMGVSASGGSGGSAGSGASTARGGNGGAGGSGGGAGGAGGYSGGMGGVDGASGASGGTSSAGSGGAGQGTTTRAFGEETGTLYAGGGDGGYLSSSTWDSSKHGRGAGGAGGSRAGGSGSSGYSGVIEIRWVNKI